VAVELCWSFMKCHSIHSRGVSILLGVYIPLRDPATRLPML